MFAGLAKSLLLRIAAYALFLGGFWLLYQAFQTNNILLGIGGAAAIPTAMWAMTGFRRRPQPNPQPSSNPQPETPDKSTQ